MFRFVCFGMFFLLFSADGPARPRTVIGALPVTFLPPLPSQELTRFGKVRPLSEILEQSKKVRILFGGAQEAL